MTEYTGDEVNARLVMAANAIVQKQSTVGFLVLLMRTPIISYNLIRLITTTPCTS